MNKIYITWDEILDKLQHIDQEGIRAYGVPKGGMIIAGFLRFATNVYSPGQADIILDDIVDSGNTRDQYKARFPDKEFVALFDESNKPDGWLVFPWEADHPAGEETVQDNITRMLEYIGEDPGRDGLLKTPDRIVRSWDELYGGYKKDPSEVFTMFEKDGYDQMVVLQDIELYSMCEHHMLPFYGKAHVAYIPNKKVVGISKLARLVDIYARRLQIQERLAQQVTDDLMKYLQPKGAACVIEATHMCMRMRGVSKQNSVMLTSSLQGAFKDDLATRQEFLSRI